MQSIMDNLPPSPPSSFVTPKQVKQKALHSIKEKVNYKVHGI
jgi:hypothetical protein